MLKVEHPDFEHLGAAEIIGLYTTQTEQIRFLVGLYEGICCALESLTGNAELMRQLGNNSPHVFASIIARGRTIACDWKNYC